MIARAGILFLGLLFLWQITILLFHIPNFILPNPLDVLREISQQLSLLGKHTIITLVEIIFGLLLGILLGSCAALAMTISRLFKFWVLPIMVMSQAIPVFAIAPLLVLWLGFGVSSKIITIVLMLFFPVASSFYDGLKRTPSYWLDTAKTMSGSKWRSLWLIQVPAALPSLASGCRLAASIAPIGAIVSEWMGASHGLGYLMITAGARLDTALVFSCLIMIMLLGFGLYLIVDLLLKRLLFWQV